MFLVFISDLEKNLESSIVELLKYVDDSKIICEIGSPEDVEDSQKSLDVSYRWAAENNMKCNDGKFQVVRLGKLENLKEETYFFPQNFSD